MSESSGAWQADAPETYELGRAFGNQPLPAGVDGVKLPATVGLLTALHAAAPGSRRGTVVIIPGFTGAKEDYVELVALLAEAGWNTWAYSQRGQGDSEAPVGIGRYRLEDFGNDAVEVARLIGGGQPVHLLGHSFGGLVARWAVIAAPTSFRTLTLLCSGPRGWGDRFPDIRPIIAAGGSLGLWGWENPALSGLDDQALTPSQALVKGRATRTSDDNVASIAEILRTAADATPELRETGVPVHVVHGEFDDGWPTEWQRQMADDLNADYSVIPGGSHSPQEESPEATATELLSFWNVRST